MIRQVQARTPAHPNRVMPEPPARLYGRSSSIADDRGRVIMMDASAAHSFATATHVGQRTRSGELLLEHLRRVAEAVGPEDRATAWLHDTLERSPTSTEELRACGMTAVEADALGLLTRSATESYELYALRIAHAPGSAGRLARTIKLADLDDHLRGTPGPDDPPYAWARRHIVNALEAEGEPVREPPHGAGP